MMKDVESQIISLETKLNVTLPQVYHDYLKDNPEGFYENISIFSIASILERNITDEVMLYSPGYIIIGDDCGDQRFLMKSGKNETAVYAVDVGDMTVAAHKLLCPDFSEWEKSSFFVDRDSSAQVYNITLLSCPDGGMKELLTIKKALGLTCSSSELLSITKNTPVILRRNVNCGMVQVIKRRLAETVRLFRFDEIKE